MLLPPYPEDGYPDEGWPKPPSISIRENVPIPGSDGLHVDLLEPRNASGPLPALIWLHGGGWRWGNRRVAMERLFPLVEAGFLCIPTDYRLSDRAQFPAQLDDVKRVLQWAARGPKGLKLDPTRIAVFGGSAGGHLGLLAALSMPCEIVGCVAAFAPSDFSTMDDFPATVTSALEHRSPDSCEGRLLGGALDQRAELARIASPISHVRRDAPPILLFHGDCDAVVPVGQSRQLARALRDAGADVTYHEIPGGGHSAEGFPPHWIQTVKSWLQQQTAPKDQPPDP